MNVTVRCFSTVRERLGADRLLLELPPRATLGEAVARLAARSAEAAVLVQWLADGHLRLAHNRVHAAPSTPLQDGDEVALFPPVSGG